MFNLFYNNNTIRYPSYINKEWDNIRFKYTVTYNKVQEYYFNRISPVPNDHILNRILNRLITLLPDDITDEILIASYIDTVKEGVNRSFKVASIASKGAVLNSGLYKGSQDILVYTEFDTPLGISDMWETLTPVKFIYHNDNTISLVPPDSRVESKRLYIYYIDYKLLYIQYSHWCKYRGDNSKDTGLFISQYVLPNMLPSLVDIGLINRYIGTYYNKKIDSSFKSPIDMFDYSGKINKLIASDIKKLKDKRITYIELLYNIPTIYGGTVYSTLFLNDYLYNNNNKFVLYVSRLPIIRFMLDLLGKNGIESNSALLSILQTEIILLENSKVLDVLPDDLKVDVMDMLDDIEFM